MENAKNTLRLAVIGLGGRGYGMMANLLDMDDTDVVAVCDRYSDRVEAGAKLVTEKKGRQPKGYQDYKELLSADSYDAVFVFTSWNNHVVPAIAALKAGFSVAFEVGGAYSTEECWELVRAQEESGKQCMLLENCCYGRAEMAVLRMIKEGLFGEIVHCRGGYEHDLRDEITLGRENRHYRFDQYRRRDGDLYPTHHLGPINKFLNINHGNRMLTLSCQTSKAVSLNAWAEEHKGADYDAASMRFAQGDIAVTTIKCAGGELIVSTHDTSLPRPYSRGGRVQGTKGAWLEDANGIFFDNAHDEQPSWEHKWDSFDTWRDKYEHPLWSEYMRLGVRGGHDGMDYLVLRAFLESVRYNTATPIDVYDSAAMMSIVCLSEQSAAMGGMPVPVPDFTRGGWTSPEFAAVTRHPIAGKYALDIIPEIK